MTGSMVFLPALMALTASVQARMLPPGEMTGMEPVLEEERRDVWEQQISTLSWKYDVPKERIGELRRNGAAWEEIERFLLVATRAKKPLAEIVRLRESGMPWAAIARRYGLRMEVLERGLGDKRSASRGKVAKLSIASAGR